MVKKMPKNKPVSSASKVALIGGIAAAAAIGGYFIYHNTDAKKQIKKVRGWALKAKGEVLEKVEKLKEVNEDMYYGIIDAVLSRYQKVSNIDAGELIRTSKELKSHWKSIQKDMTEGGKKVSQVVKKVVDAGIKNKEVKKVGAKNDKKSKKKSV